jgi:hypothetical protein
MKFNEFWLKATTEEQELMADLTFRKISYLRKLVTQPGCSFTTAKLISRASERIAKKNPKLEKIDVRSILTKKGLQEYRILADL